MARTQPAVDIRDLRITFDTDGGTVQAVRGVDLEVQPGEVLAIVLTVLGLTLVGESLNDLADPRLRARRKPAEMPGQAVAAEQPAAREELGEVL